ncbi:MAG TPA: hypothetical protein EYP14_20100, partial [Planctomycetaceae bacterium]|nr:hypothetical protein [Planctomycetaceae bacterium]
HPDMPHLFDQMHVLNEGRFASRYFPGVGLWMAPFVAVGHPCWGHWLAGAVTAVFVFGIGRELANNGVGFLAGLLTALAPGQALFSNLLLSHHPTLLGLTLFLYCFMRMQRTRGTIDAVAAGTGLSYAMLCRPLTAFGVGLPFGLVFAAAWLRAIIGDRADDRKVFLRLAIGLGGPILAGLLLLFAYDRAITGSGWMTPYQLYTDTYTPRHVYGFNNVVRGEQRLGPRVLDNYDRWAENLTLPLAMRNVRNRLLASWQWTVGLVPLLMTTIVFVVRPWQTNRGWWLIGAAIVSLHAVYVPYWYDGIMHWHYVFESGPLWTLLLAGVTGWLIGVWNQEGRTAMPVWWGLVLGAAVLVNWVSLPPFWSPSRLKAGVSEFAFARQKYQVFHELIERAVTERPALVLVEPDPSDRHIDFVVNDPGLDADVLFGRWPTADERRLQEQLKHILRTFPDRTVYRFRATDWTIWRIAKAEPA